MFTNIFYFPDESAELDEIFSLILLTNKLIYSAPHIFCYYMCQCVCMAPSSGEFMFFSASSYFSYEQFCHV
jgi:hypothetical protein